MKVQIHIRGRSYTVRSDDDGGDLRAIAQYVDARMAEIAARARNADEYTIAMLAALNIAEELDRLRRQVDEELGAIDRDLATTALLLDGAPQGAEA